MSFSKCVVCDSKSFIPSVIVAVPEGGPFGTVPAKCKKPSVRFQYILRGAYTLQNTDKSGLSGVYRVGGTSRCVGPKPQIRNITRKGDPARCFVYG